MPDPNASPAASRRGLSYALIAIAVAVAAALAWHFLAPGRTTGGAPAGAGGRESSGAGPAGAGGGRPGAFGARGPLPVAVAVARSADFPVYIDAIGTVTARNTVTVRPRVDGQLIRVLFREGQTVRAGDLLAEIDPRPFQVQLTQAEGQLARDQAQLANARIDLERYQTLLKQDSIASQQVDTQAALVRQLAGTIEADRGAVDNAKLQLSYTRITAPLAGRLGLRQVDPGNIVHASDAGGIVIITEVQPIGVVFSIPEDRLPTVLRRTRSDAAIPVDAYDRDGKRKLESGKLVTIDNQIDPTTGTIKLKAEFANADGGLFPNQFVNVRMNVDTLVGATVIPTPAIQRGSPGTFVYRVENGDTVAVRKVVLGPADGESTVVTEGLAPGDRVVVDGTDKLRDGAKIEAVDRAAPAGAAAAAATTTPAAPAMAARARPRSATPSRKPGAPGN
ncbi:MAG: MdtA/MuxA family multidrug efflux RND transporter periplasmic adaptor subunit [Candidatus Levyibacteriota bacterium]